MRPTITFPFLRGLFTTKFFTVFLLLISSSLPLISFASGLAPPPATSAFEFSPVPTFFIIEFASLATSSIVGSFTIRTAAAIEAVSLQPSSIIESVSLLPSSVLEAVSLTTFSITGSATTRAVFYTEVSFRVVEAAPLQAFSFP